MHIVPGAESLQIEHRVAPTTSSQLQVFGDDFDTPDGTCIRDYVHIADLCAAHLLAMERLMDGKVSGFNAFNLGTGNGYSVKDVIVTCRRITGQD